MTTNRSLGALRATLFFSLGLGCPGGDTDKTETGIETGTPGALCEGSTPITDADGVPTGYERCADGTVHRVTVGTADATIDLGACIGDEAYMSCTTDAECTAGAHGFCAHDDHVDLGGKVVPGTDDGCFCAYSCSSDAECSSDQACLPSGIVDKEGNTWSTCVQASCHTDADCDSGECGLTSYNNGCYYDTNLACRDPAADACRTDDECPTDESCAMSYPSDNYDCYGYDCAIGRPLLVAGAARSAAAIARADWAADADLVGLDALSGDLRAALAEHWRAIAAMEHASVASFSRFSLQLMALGAPPELLMGAQRAAADEIEHARLAYGLASAYGGASCGPGPLSLAGLSMCTDLAAVMVSLIEEACVGETVGAAEAADAASRVADPSLRATLLRVADDESRHAALAWRALRWMLEQDAGLAPLARQTFADAVAAMRASPLPDGPVAPDHGLLAMSERATLREAALRQVVEPCVAGLLGERPDIARAN